MTGAAGASTLEEEIGGVRRPLLLRLGEIEKFEAHWAPYGVLALFDQLMGKGQAPQLRHVRDIVALGLIGGGMRDGAADQLVRGLPLSETRKLQAIAGRLLGLTFYPDVASGDAKKKASAGSAKESATPPVTDGSAPET
ncbi:GTA-gp10 family protein [Wenxinia saemankumensis]|uniref:Phage tail tube protein, GTA-gp10 n=1 Tax=Wenxinia saemankumensis TaxID=1447782 RepID=A0A1M6F032_9RHOB|nr:GTA-gp10 family protein [Wenxinia saemankumensis]SHI91047.1 Phage tail tube protein, GTA-gp10 [Wenxinia saemankumensis]